MIEMVNADTARVKDVSYVVEVSFSALTVATLSELALKYMERSQGDMLDCSRWGIWGVWTCTAILVVESFGNGFGLFAHFLSGNRGGK